MKKPKVIRERDIERYLVKTAKALGGEVRKVKWIGRRGAPDRVVMLPAYTAKITNEIFMSMTRLSVLPQTIWIELKAPGKKPTIGQLREHARMRAMGQRVEVVDSMAGVDRLFE